MVNFNKPTKMMVNRYIQLLNAKIAGAQSRHVPRRLSDRCPQPRIVDLVTLRRERQKTERYEATKRLSMWEQDEYPPNEKPQILRMDQLHYKHLGVKERSYKCTWANFQNEQLNAKIAGAQSRHVPRRLNGRCPQPRNVDLNTLQRERQKTERYEATKRLSMWEQAKYPPNEKPQTLRLDQLHYKHLGVKERPYKCTWANFQNVPKPKMRAERFIDKGYVPVRHCKIGQVPNTAKPLDDEAKDFIKQWTNNFTTIHRNRVCNSANASSKCKVENQIGKPLK